jgi:two-component system response regulator ChvI
MPALPEREKTFGQNDKLAPGQPAAPATIGQAEIRRVVLVESDQYYREVLAFELLRQGFVVHAFPDGASLLGSLAIAVNADLAVLDWDLPKMPGIKLLAELRQHGLNLPVVFLAGRFIRDNEHERLQLAPREALNADECMAFDHGAVDFISKSRDRQVLVRRLRNVVELVKPKADVAVEVRVACDKLVLNTEISRAFWNGVDVDLTRRIQARPSAGVERRLFRDLSRGLRSPALRRLYRRRRQ